LRAAFFVLAVSRQADNTRFLHSAGSFRFANDPAPVEMTVLGGGAPRVRTGGAHIWGLS
jgi:hypothetical protein